MNDNNERELLPDILRGFAIILVVFGHCIQEGSGEAYRGEALYFSDRVYQWIYSFHMPLFMLISGYLSWGSIQKAVGKKERRALLSRRASALLSPVFLWTAVDYARILLLNYFHQNPQPEAIVFVYFYNALNNLWFLWAVWWCFLIVYVMHYFLKDNIVVYILGFLALFVIPDGLGLGAYKYMLPYFVSAYYLHGYMQAKDRKFNMPKLWMLVVTGSVFAGLFAFYNEESFIYLTGYKLIGKDIVKQLQIDLYRMLIGFAGSAFFIVLWQYLIGCADMLNKSKHTNFTFRLLRKLGADSMGIYILSGYLLVFAVQRLNFLNRPSYLMNILETVIVIAVSLLVTTVLKKIPVLKKFVGK